MSFWDGTRWVANRPASPPVGAQRRPLRDWIATAIMLVGLLVILFPGNESQAAGPQLSASPPSARPGEALRISGSLFPAYSTIQLAWDGSPRRMPLIHVNGQGRFNTRLIVADTTPGAHFVTALRTSIRMRGLASSAAVAPLASVAVTVLAPGDGDAASPSAAVPNVAAATVTETAQPTAAPTALPTDQPTALPTAVPTHAAPPPPPPPPPAAGLPDIPASYGSVFRKVFTDGTMGPFRVLTYPDDHIGQDGQYWTGYNRFSNGANQASVHNGYLDLRATRRSDGLWDAVLVGTSQGGNGPTFGYGVFRYWLSFNIAPATWQAAWLYDTTSWSSTEIDFPEMLENQSLTAHVLGSGAGGAYGLPRPANLGTVFHEFKVERRATFVAFSIDGAEVARVNGAMPSSKLAILLDSCVGFPWMGAAGAPSGSTPGTVYLHVAAITVDP
jgi:hypothetical protein